MKLFKLDIIEIYRHKRELEYLAIGLGLVLALLVFFLSQIIFASYMKKDIAFVILSATVSAFVGLLPFMVLQFILGKEQKAVEDVYPSFLRDWAESVSSGLGVIRALQLTSKADYGALNKYVRKLVIWLSWGVPFPVAMKRFNEYFSFSPTIKRTNEIILEIYKSGGDIVKTLRELADNVEKTRELYKDIIAQVKSRVYVIYAIYFMLLIIAAMFKPIFVNMAGNKGGIVGGGLPPSYFKQLSFMMILSFAISSSIMAAAITGGNIADAIKHASILFLTGLLAYVFFVLPPTLDCSVDIVGKDKMALTLKVEGEPYTGTAYVNGKPVSFKQGTAITTAIYDKPIKIAVNTDFGKRTCQTVLAVKK